MYLPQFVDVPEDGVDKVGPLSLREQVAMQGHHIALDKVSHACSQLYNNAHERLMCTEFLSMS